VFKQIIDSKKAKHITDQYRNEGLTINNELLKYLVVPSYLVMPAMVKGKVIGLFVADRHASKRQINDEDFQAFQQLCQQANMGLTFLMMQG
jgi:GAF domain-containing protein